MMAEEDGKDQKMPVYAEPVHRVQFMRRRWMAASVILLLGARAFISGMCMQKIPARLLQSGKTTDILPGKRRR